MSYKKPKAIAINKIKWDHFVNTEFKLFHETGLPLSYYEDEDNFTDFLMHGYIDHHHDVIRYSIDDMSPSQRANLKCLLIKYYMAGFADPGSTILSTEEYRELRSNFPEAFPRRKH